MKPDGIFVLKKDKNEVVARISQVCSGPDFTSGMGVKQRVALFKTCCGRAQNIIDDCFVTEMHAPSKCKQILVTMIGYDDINQVESGIIVLWKLLSDLRCIVQNAVRISELPSCRKLTELSSKDAATVASDLVKSDIVKGIAKTILIGFGILDSIKISDVKNYYCALKSELQKELEEDNRLASLTEQYLLEKFDAEIGYCDLAAYKAGLCVAKETADLLDIARKNIEKFENRSSQSVQLGVAK